MKYKRLLVPVLLIVAFVVMAFVPLAQPKLPTEVWVLTAYRSADFTKPIDMRTAAYAGLKVVGQTSNGWLQVASYADVMNGEAHFYVPPYYVSACPIGALVEAKAGWDEHQNLVSMAGGTVVGCGNLQTLLVEQADGKRLYVPTNPFLIDDVDKK